MKSRWFLHLRMWNSRNHKIIGLAMTQENQASLHDVFQLFDKDHRVKQASYMLQFLWRDVTSSFDIVGPYFSSEESVNSKFICSCFLETIKLFHISCMSFICSFVCTFINADSWVTDEFTCL